MDILINVHIGGFGSTPAPATTAVIAAPAKNDDPYGTVLTPHKDDIVSILTLY
jgi:hypothetical protein